MPYEPHDAPDPMMRDFCGLVAILVLALLGAVTVAYWALTAA